MSTIRDVAERAGVAPTTVSRVINNWGYVSQETRDRVEAAVAELKYVPNTLAGSLRSHANIAGARTQPLDLMRALLAKHSPQPQVVADSLSTTLPTTTSSTSMPKTS